MIQPPTEEQLAELWFKGLAPGDQELWREEVSRGTDRDDTDVSALECWRLYWSRGPQLGDRDLGHISRGDCPICARRGFVIGPGAFPDEDSFDPIFTVNIECAQLDCRSRFNVCFVSGGAAVMGHHLPNGATSNPWPSEPVYIAEPVEPDMDDDYADRAEWKNRVP